jgi:hypothetical protein
MPIVVLKALLLTEEPEYVQPAGLPPDRLILTCISF